MTAHFVLYVFAFIFCLFGAFGVQARVHWGYLAAACAFATYLL